MQRRQPDCGHRRLGRRGAAGAGRRAHLLRAGRHDAARGRDYVFLREAYGPLGGFLYGWMRFGIANSGGQAAGVVAFATFLNIVTGGALDTYFFLFRPAGLSDPIRPLAGRVAWSHCHRDFDQLRHRINKR